MVEQIKNTYKELFLFLRKPVDKPHDNQTFKKKFLTLFAIFALGFILSFVFVILLGVLSKYGFIPSEDHKLAEFLNSMSKVQIIALTVIIVPIIEELIFRLYLRYKNNYLLQLFMSLFYILGTKRKNRIEKRIKKIWYKKYAYVFYFSAILFGFVHILNFKSAKSLLLFLPIITAPQIVVGILAGYLRVRFNLVLGIFLHAIHNMVFILPFLILGNSIEVVKEDTDDYFLQIEEVINKGKSISTYFPDSISFQNYKLKSIIAYTTNKNSRLIVGNNKEKMDKVLNVQYKNKQDSTGINRDIIEKKLTNLYKFKIEKENRLVGAWVLFFKDSLKLDKYKTKLKRKRYSIHSKDSLVVQGAKLSQIIYSLQNAVKKKMFLREKKEGFFDIKLRITDTTYLKKQLDSIYGIKLIDSLATEEYLNINFQN